MYGIILRIRECAASMREGMVLYSIGGKKFCNVSIWIDEMVASLSFSFV